MEIYIVQPGDTIESIADRYGVSAGKIIQDNNLTAPIDLVTGQSIVIVYPKQTHSVQEGETLDEIANTYGIGLLQLLRNNPFLFDRNNLIPGDLLTIRYDTHGQIITHGFVYPFIAQKTLIKTLPNLTYISIYNYMAEANGGISVFYDDTQIIQLSKDYGVVPLMLLSTLSPQGKENTEVAAQIMSNEEVQDIQIENMLNIMEAKGYYGININFNFVNPATQQNYLNFLAKISDRMKQEGYMVFVTINPARHGATQDVFERLDYSSFAALVENIIFLHFIWGSNDEPPMPVVSYTAIDKFLDYVTQTVPPQKIVIGVPVIGYDWVLPFITGQHAASSITPSSALSIARNNKSVIQNDAASQTPFIEYEQSNQVNPIKHIVWYVNSTTIHAFTDLISKYGLAGIAIWNIMVYVPQLWLVIYSQYDVVKLIP